MEYFENDVVLLVTDGLTNELESSEIIDVINSFDDVYDISMNLVDRAIDKGGRDNVTVTIIKV